MADRQLSGRRTGVPSADAGARAADGAKAGGEWIEAFLAELAATSNVKASATKAGVSTFVVYEQRRRDSGFGARWREALCEGYDHLEMALLHRLRTGELKPAAGAKRGARLYDNATSFRLLAAHREAVAQQRALRDNQDADAILASINLKLEKMRERRLAAEALEAEEAAQAVEGAGRDAQGAGDIS